MLNQGDVLQERYRVVAQLGKGGMGAVYRAWDIRLSIPVALKEMVAPPDVDTALLENLRAQFQQEATVLARLSHPNLVGVTDYFQESHSVYLVMKYVEGESLADRIQRLGPVPESQVVVWAAQLLDALAYCHGQSVIHRDIKPQNIIIRSDGVAVLVDFGLVKLWNPDDPRTRTAVRGVGTPHYAPPEQYELSAGHTEPRSDLYSLGATLYHALTGQIPPSATLRVASPEEFAPIRSVARGISPQLAATIERAMELPRSRRWSSAVEMAQALEIDVRSWGPGGTATAELPGASMTGNTVVALPTVPPIAKEAPEKRPPRGMARRGRRTPFWIPLGIVVALLLVAGSVLVALAFSGVVDLGLPARWTPWLETPVPAETVVPAEVAPMGTPPLPPSATEAPPTATATHARPSPTVRPAISVAGGAKTTASPSPTATHTPTVTPTPRPASAISSPTAGPSSTVSASPTVGASPTAGAPAVTGALVSFETWGTWQRGDEPYGELTQTQEQVKGGQYAAKLAYQFPAVANDYVVFMQSRAVAGQPDTFSAWVYGDGSGQYLNLWTKDAQGEIWSVHLGTIGSAGWRQMSGRLAAGAAWPSGHIGGPDNGIVDYPVQFYALVLDRPAANPSQGTIYIDEIGASTQGAALPQSQPTPLQPAAAPPTASPTATPTPVVASGAIGRIIFTVQSADGYYLYSTDPAWTQMQEIGRTDQAQSTCGGAASASTLDGRAFSFFAPTQCAITERTDACTSPDAAYKLITNFLPGWTYSVLLKNVATGSETFIYEGRLNDDLGVQWAGTSQYVYFGIDTAVHVVRLGGSYQQVVSSFDAGAGTKPTFTPDGAAIFYMRPSGGSGNSDVYIVNVDGSGERNLTNAPATKKSCPRWRF